MERVSRRQRSWFESPEMTGSKLSDLGRAQCGMPDIDEVLGFLACTADELFPAFTGNQGVICPQDSGHELIAILGGAIDETRLLQGVDVERRRVHAEGEADNIQPVLGFRSRRFLVPPHPVAGEEHPARAQDPKDLGEQRMLVLVCESWHPC